jgi:hypothetical protein
LDAAWRPFHSPFDNNPDEVATAIYEGCFNNIKYLSSNNLSGADSNKIFDLAENPFGDLVTEPDVVRAFAEKMKNETKTLPTPMDAVSRIARGGWNSEDEESLATISVDEFVRFFKSMRGKGRTDFIFGSLAFRKLGGRTPRQQQIADNALSALVKIGRESPLNAHRLKAYNVTLPKNEEAGTPPG